MAGREEMCTWCADARRQHNSSVSFRCHRKEEVCTWRPQHAAVSARPQQAAREAQQPRQQKHPNTHRKGRRKGALLSRPHLQRPHERRNAGNALLRRPLQPAAVTSALRLRRTASLQPHGGKEVGKAVEAQTCPERKSSMGSNAACGPVCAGAHKRCITALPHMMRVCMLDTGSACGGGWAPAPAGPAARQRAGGRRRAAGWWPGTWGRWATAPACATGRELQSRSNQLKP